MKVYIGGSYSGRHRIQREVQFTPWREEVEILSRWFDDQFFLEKAWDGDLGGDVGMVMARLDASQIQDADLVIIDSIDKSSTGGSDTEFGIARGLGKRIVHIGPVRNIFFNLADVNYPDWEHFREFETGRGKAVEA